MHEPSPSQLLLRAIHDQTSSVPANLIYVLDIVSIRFGGSFTPELRLELQKYYNLQMLTLNDCGITSLEGFPHLPNLIRLDLVFNGITGADLGRLRGLRHLQTLMLGANRIQTIEELQQIDTLTNLLQLDLINNPVCKVPGYREKVFAIFPRLLVLDTLDRSGKDAYNNVTMMEAVHRVPDHLFSNNEEENRMVQFAHHEQRARLGRALSRLGSLDEQDIPKRVKKPKKVRKDQQNKLTRRKSFQFGTLFPSTKIRRMLKHCSADNLRVTRSSAVYLSAVLQFLTAQFLAQAGQQAISQRRSRITPLILKDCLVGDEELGKLMKSATFGMGP